MDSSPLKILAIDDHEDNLIVLRATLRDALPQAQVSVALDARTGLERARAEDPDMILLDLAVPGMDACEVCRMLKGDEQLRSIPVIVLTAGRTDRDSRLRALEEGAEAFLSKPIDEVELIAQVRAMAKIKGASKRQEQEAERLAELVAQRTRELERELTERKQVEESLRQSEQNYREVFNAVNDAIFVHDADTGAVLDVNESMLRLYGLGRDEALRLNLNDASLGGSPYSVAEARHWMSKTIAEGPQVFEWQARKKSGELFWVEVALKYAQINGQPRILAIVRDVSERKQAEETLRESEERLRLAHKASNDVVWDWDVIHDTQKWNESGTVVFGWTDIVERPQTAHWWVERVHPEDLQRVSDGFFAVVDNPEADCWHDEYRFRKADGSYAQVMDRGYVLRDRQGKALRMIGAMLDITERKRAEEALRQSEERFRAVFDNAAAMVAVSDRTGQWTHANQHTIEKLGYSLAELCRMQFNEFTHPADREQNRLLFDRIVRGEADHGRIVKRYVRKDGGIVWVDLSASPIHNEKGEVEAVIGVALDITARKQMEKVVQQRTRYIETVMENSPIGYAVRSASDDKARFVSRRFEEICGVPHGSLDSSEAFFNLVFPDPVFREQFRARVRADHASGDPARMRWENLPAPMASGEVRYLTVTAIPVPEQNLVVSTVQDVTDRVRAEQKLRESEKRYRTLFETAGDAIFLIQEDHFIDCNLRAIQMFGAGTQDQIVGHAPYELAPPRQPGGRDSRELAFEKITAALAGAPQFFEWMHIKSDGTLFPAEVSLNRVELGARVLLQAIVRDITERKRAEEALRESESKLRAIFECSRDAIGLSKRGVFIFANPAYLKMFGCQSNETLAGTSILSHIAPSHRPQMLHTVERRAAGEDFPLLYETRGMKTDGTEFDMEVSVSTYELLGETYTVATIRDVTGRKQAERERLDYQRRLRSLASELSLAEERERRRIATGLHDHACQTLVLSKMKLQRLQTSLPSGGVDAITDVCNTLDKTIESVREMTFDLSSPALYRFGLEAALKELLKDKLKAEHGIRTVFRDDDAPKPLAEDVRIVLFQSVRELLINVIKHARAHEVILDISRRQDSIRITVVDDGVGFDAGNMLAAPSRSRGFGLFNIKERLDFLGGTLDVDSRPGRGSRFTLVAPLERHGPMAGEAHDDDQNLAG